VSVRAVAVEPESAEHPPAVAVQFVEPLVFRVAAVVPVPWTTVAFVVVAPLPEQPAASSQSTRVSAVAVPAESAP
jgi:hypothetical protein